MYPCAAGVSAGSAHHRVRDRHTGSRATGGCCCFSACIPACDDSDSGRDAARTEDIERCSRRRDPLYGRVSRAEMDRLSRTGRALHCDFSCRARECAQGSDCFSGNSCCNDRAVPVYAVRAACFRSARVVQCCQWCVSLQCAVSQLPQYACAQCRARSRGRRRGGGQSAPEGSQCKVGSADAGCAAAAGCQCRILLQQPHGARHLRCLYRSNPQRVSLKCCGHSRKRGGSVY